MPMSPEDPRPEEPPPQEMTEAKLSENQRAIEDLRQRILQLAVDLEDVLKERKAKGGSDQ